MRRAVVFPNKYDPTFASARIAKFLADTFKVELWDSPEKLQREPIDELWYVFGMVAFCPWRNEIGSLAPFVEKYVYVENDFLGSHLTQLRKPLYERRVDAITISTVPSRVNKEKDRVYSTRGVYFNWNRLTWDPVPDHRVAPMKARNPGLVYYGHYRKDRVHLFTKYMKDTPYDVNVFSGTHSKREFSKICEKIVVHEKAENLNETLNEYQFTIYMEDSFSSSKFTSPANRFYECLAAGVPILFDTNTRATMAEVGVDISKWEVKNKHDVAAKIPHLKQIQAQQSDLRSRNYLKEMKQDLKEVLRYVAMTSPEDPALKEMRDLL